MWSDKETTEDLLGYTVHASLLKSVVTNDKNLPIKILEEELKNDNDTVVVYFDGWSFESFDDAKMALFQGIIDALEKDERFFAKVGDKATETYKALKKAFAKLKKSISWMRVLKFSVKTVVPVATAATTGGASLIIPMLLSAFKDHQEDLGELLTGDKAEQFLKIKLFLNVPKTAFVIAADSYIVTNAIKSEYRDIIDAASDERPQLGNSYLEKFIQLPYKIPALSPKEVETYVTLLFCQSILDNTPFKKVREDFATFTKENKFDRYGWSNIQKLLNREIPTGLGETIGFVTRFSTIIGNSLKWNPRLIKRFLNAYEMRSSLLEQSGITDMKFKFALLKLMLIEQKHEDQFKQLNSWVMSNPSTPPELRVIEEYADGKCKDLGEHQDWNSPDLMKLVSETPKFSEVDMKELFWVSRDIIVEQMSGLSLVSTRIRSVFNHAYNASTDTVRENVCKNEIAELSSNDLEELYDLIDSKILTEPTDKEGYSLYYFCIMHEIERAYIRMLSTLGRIDTSKIPYPLGNKFKAILEKYNNDKKLMELLEKNKRLMRSINGN